MFRRILFAHNGQPVAEKAIPYLEHLARADGAEVIVLHVYQPPALYTASGGYQQLLDSWEALAQEVVDDTVTHLREGGFEARGVVKAGEPASVILEVAREEDVSLIVLGARGPSSVKELLIGDVSTEVLRRTRRPVLLVP
ncbi:MAG: universal stress protein [Anaerolineae bacterium]